ncbi:MAG: hypothetical protein AAB582_00115 [Patescibacteria group bacterium]
MKAKVLEKEKAILLRKQGMSYKDILAQIPVAKSSLSMWLQDLPLTEEEKHNLKRRKDGNISRGRIRAATSLHRLREARDSDLYEICRKEFAQFAHDPFFQVGISLYWAEGAKRSSNFGFTNSDPEMVMVMIRWINKYLDIKTSDLRLRLYTHRPFASENQEEYWAKETGIPRQNFGKTVYKPTGLLVKKRPNYKGCIRIEIGKVLYLRKMLFWQRLLIEYYRKER